jgi:secondary thiamine-phosphate synthase enzyme
MIQHTDTVTLKSEGNCHLVECSARLQEIVRKSGVRQGMLCAFVFGSTAGLTTIEFEPGLEHDMKEMFERLIPRDMRYEHEERWHDDNGHSHVRASLLGPSIAIPIDNAQLTLGTWQQVVMIDFDTRPRARELRVTVIGE